MRTSLATSKAIMPKNILQSFMIFIFVLSIIGCGENVKDNTKIFVMPEGAVYIDNPDTAKVVGATMIQYCLIVVDDNGHKPMLQKQKRLLSKLGGGKEEVIDWLDPVQSFDGDKYSQVKIPNESKGKIRMYYWTPGMSPETKKWKMVDLNGGGIRFVKVGYCTRG